MQQYLQNFFKKFGGRYKRIRRRCKGKPLPEYYDLQVEKLKELEQMSLEGKIDLFYGDESHICSEGYVHMAGSFPVKKYVSPLKRHIKSTALA